MITYRFVSQTFLGEPIKVQYSKYSSPTRIDLGSGTFPFEYTTDQKGGTYFFYIPKVDTTFTKTINIPPIDFVVNSMNVPDCDISGIINEIPECDISSGIIEIPVCDVDYVITIVTPTPTPTPSVVCPVITGVTVGPIEISGGQPYTLVDNISSLYLYQFDSSGQYICDIPSQSNSILPNSLFQNEITVIVPSPYWFGGPCQYCFNIISGELVECNFVIPSPTPTPTLTTTQTPTPSITSTATTTLTPTPSVTPTLPIGTPTKTPTPTITSSITPTNTLTPTITPTPISLTTYYGTWSDYTQKGGLNCTPTLSGLTTSTASTITIFVFVNYVDGTPIVSLNNVAHSDGSLDTYSFSTNSNGLIVAIADCDDGPTKTVCSSNQFTITNNTGSSITVNNLTSPFTNISLPKFNLSAYTSLIVCSCTTPTTSGGSVTNNGTCPTLPP